MKKTLQIHIAKTLFTIEEDAYAALETYLSSVRAHFDATDARDEIIADIEARIAEQLLESKEAVITLPTVERVTAQMGSVTDFDDEENAGAGTSRRKRLYRDTDTGLLAGVSSGLAAYFGLNVIVVRLFFLVLTLGNGFGILVYIILWLTVPEAKTASQRLEMSGEPVNLATIREIAAERMRDTTGRRIGMLVARVTALLVTLFRFAIGAGLVLFSAAAAIAVLVAAGYSLSSTAWLTVDVPMSALLPGNEYWIVLLAAIIAALIPLFFMLIAGLALLMKRISVSARTALVLLGIWLVMLVACSFGIAETVTNYQQYVAAAPEYQTESQPLELGGSFTSVVVEDGVHLEIVESTTTEATLIETGHVKDLGGYSASVEDGVLTVTSLPVDHHSCILCGISHSRIVLTVPSLSAIEVRDGASVHSSGFPAQHSLTVTLDGNAHANLEVAVQSLKISANDGSQASVSGTAATAVLIADSDSYIDADDLKADTAEVSAERSSHIDVRAATSLEARARDASFVSYSGSPTVTRDADSDSVIESAR